MPRCRAGKVGERANISASISEGCLRCASGKGSFMNEWRECRWGRAGQAARSGDLIQQVREKGTRALLAGHMRSGSHPRAHSAGEDTKGLQPAHPAYGSAVLPACQEPWQGWCLALGRGQGLLSSGTQGQERDDPGREERGSHGPGSSCGKG